MYTRDNRILSAGLRIGGITRGCVNMTFSSFNDNTLHINSIDYNERCSVRGKQLARGDGTRKMINAALTYMLKHPKFGHQIEHITLNDASNVPCIVGDNNIREVSLMYSYIALKGKTWYESRFSAVIRDVTLKKSYEACIQKLYDPLFKASVTSNSMYDRMIAERINTHVANDLTTLYSDSSTLNEFFNRIHRDHTFCVVTYRWIDIFIDFVIFKGTISSQTIWEIPINKIVCVELHITPADGPPQDVFPIKGGTSSRMQRYHQSHGAYSHRYGWVLN